MEKRKLLLVAVSVGVFLVIVLSAAILIFTPSGGGSILAARSVFPETVSQPAVSASSTGTRGPASADAADMIRNPGEIQGLIIPPSGVPSLSVTSESSGAVSPSFTASSQRTSAQENNFYINGESSSTAVADTGNVVISVPKPATPGIPVPENQTSSPAVSSAQSARQGTTVSGAAASPARSVTAAPAAAPVTVKPESTAAAQNTGTPVQPAGSESPSGGVSPARSSTTPAVSATTRSTAASPAKAENTSASRITRDYWIQTGAFSALVRAEDAKESLAAKGLSSIIDNREVDGQIWYRVRVGPYTSENEAGYWLALVQAIDGFGESQIRSTQR